MCNKINALHHWHTSLHASAHFAKNTILQNLEMYMSIFLNYNQYWYHHYQYITMLVKNILKNNYKSILSLLVSLSLLQLLIIIATINIIIIINLLCRVVVDIHLVRESDQWSTCHFPCPSHTSEFKTGTQADILPGVWCRKVSAGT